MGLTDGFYSTGAAEDGRAPTEELPCLRSMNFCPGGAIHRSILPGIILAVRYGDRLVHPSS